MSPQLGSLASRLTPAQQRYRQTRIARRRGREPINDIRTSALPAFSDLLRAIRTIVLGPFWRRSRVAAVWKRCEVCRGKLRRAGTWWRCARCGRDAYLIGHEPATV